MAAIAPFDFRLTMYLTVDRFADGVEHLRAALEGFSWPKIVGFESPRAIANPRAKRLPAGISGDLPEAIARLFDFAKVPSNVRFYFTSSLSSWMSLGKRDDKPFALTLCLSPMDSLFTDPADCVRATTHITRRLLERDVVKSVQVQRMLDQATCLPFVPLAGCRDPLVLTADAEVAGLYDRPDDFWSAGWTIERFGERSLLTRCQNVVYKGEVLREIRDHQWQMARAAKPQLTAYGPAEVAPDEQELFEAGKKWLYAVGVDSTGTLELSCVLERGAHVRGWEIFQLWEILHRKQLPDGHPVTAIRVVFLEPWMAESEKRPLLDIGAQVFYEDAATGDRIAITS